MNTSSRDHAQTADIALDVEDGPLGGIEKFAPDAPLSPAVAIAALALNYSMKYHDIGTVQDGTLYQQYKLEGRNMVPLHLDMIFETAARIERHILDAPNRLSMAIYEQALEAISEPDVDEPSSAEQVSGQVPGMNTEPQLSTGEQP